MTFHLRSLSARRYRIEGDLPGVHDPEFARRLHEKRFQNLAPLEERGQGWVTADNCLDAEMTAEAVERGPCAVFALRIDRRRVSSRLLRARFDLEMRGRAKVAAETGGRERGKRVGRDERQEIRRGLAQEILQATPPSIEAHAVLVYPRDRVVLFQCLSRPANDAFRALFLDTFDVGLSLLTPYHRSLELLSSRGGGEALGPLRRADFGAAMFSAERGGDGRPAAGSSAGSMADWRRAASPRETPEVSS
jgi:hypothetical protein